MPAQTAPSHCLAAARAQGTNGEPVLYPYSYPLTEPCPANVGPNRPYPAVSKTAT